MALNNKTISVRKENLIKDIDNLPDEAKTVIYNKLGRVDILKELEEDSENEILSGFEIIHFIYILLVAKLGKTIEEKKNKSLTEEECFDLNVFIAERFISDISKTFEILDEKEKIILESFRRGMKLKDLKQFRRFKNRSLEQLNKDFFKARANFIDYFGLVSNLQFRDDAKFAEIMAVVVDGFAEDEFPADLTLLKLLNFVVRPAEDDKNRTKVKEKIKLFLRYTYTDSMFKIDDPECEYDEIVLVIEDLVKERKIKCDLPDVFVKESDSEKKKKLKNPVLELGRIYREKGIFQGKTKEHFSEKLFRISSEVVYKLQKILVKGLGVQRLRGVFEINQGEKLICACFFGDLEKVKGLIADGADINFLGEDWNPCFNPLYAGILGKEVEIVKHLIKKGVDVNFFCKGYSPLHYAIYNEASYLVLDELNGGIKEYPQPIITEILVQAGANINNYSERFGRPLGHAKRWNHKLAVELLERFGAIDSEYK